MTAPSTCRGGLGRWLACTVAGCLGLVGPASAGPVDQLAWLAGCWARDRGDAGSGEVWLPAAGGVMLGIGRTVRGGRLIDHEFLRLHEDAQGQAVYTALPSGQRETAFVATRVDADSAVFENPAHDFPQTITYRRIDPQHLVVTIEGPRQGQPRRIEFAFTRTSCAP